MKTTRIKKIIILMAMLLAANAFADEDTGKGRVNAVSAYFNNGDGVLITIKGKAAFVIFNKINFTDIQRSGNLSISVNGSQLKPSGIEIRQSDYVQCVKDDTIECKTLIGRDGSPIKLSHLQLNF